MPPTTTQKPTNPRSSMQEFRCCGCNITLGYTNGKRLVVGGVSVWHTTRFNCLVCRRDSIWIKDKAA